MYRIFYTENGRNKQIDIPAPDAPTALDIAHRKYNVPDTVYDVHYLG